MPVYAIALMRKYLKFVLCVCVDERALSEKMIRSITHIIL